MIDFDEAAKLLNLLKGDHVFQTFSEGLFKEKNVHNKKDSAARVTTSTNRDYQKILNNMQSKGAGAYVQVNGGTTRGARNVTHIRAVFLDLDGTPLQGVTDAVKDGYPKPHCIVESSPGKYHVYWLVYDCDIQMFGSIQKILAMHFGGDQCVINPDRVLRLPGSNNYKYDEPFRVRTLHLLADADALSIHDLTTFPSQPIQPADMTTAIDTATDALTSSLITTTIPNELGVLGAGDRTQKIIQLAGALVDDDINMTVEDVMVELRKLATSRLPEGDSPMTESAWVTEIEPGVRRFVERRDVEIKELDQASKQVLEDHGDIASAFVAAMEPENLSIRDFAERFVLVATSRLVYDITKSPAAEPWTLVAFKDFAGIYKNNGKSLVSLWLTRKQYRRTVHSTIYMPYPSSTSESDRRVRRITTDKSTGELCYNTYAPPLLLPMIADIQTRTTAVAVFLEHIEYLFPEKQVAEAFIDWWAATIQSPQRRVTWAPLIISTYEGVGKGWMASLLKILVGASNFRMITQDQLEGGNSQFNDFLAGSTVVVVDELKARRRDDIINRLKGMITETSLEVNAKYGAKQMVDIHANFICYSNHTDALALTEADRRYWVHILHQEPRSAAYYNRLWSWSDTDGPNHLLEYLLNRDISKFKFGRVPCSTTAKDAVIRGNWSDLDMILRNALNNKDGPFAGDVTYAELINDWLESSVKMTLETIEKSEIRTWIRKNGASLGSRNGIGTRQVTYAVRNPDYYMKATPKAIVDQLRASIAAVHDPKKPKLYTAEV